MKHRVARVATGWPFLGLLLVLVVNDWWLKAAYPGWISGKLSDFAGIAIVTALAIAVRPASWRLVYMAVTAGFTWWKSPFSESMIELVSAATGVGIGRAVDYTDLVALAVLPLSRHLVMRCERYAWRDDAVRRLLLIPALAATALATMATSVITTRDDYAIRRTASGAELAREQVAETIAEVARIHGLRCLDCANLSRGGRYGSASMHLTYTFDGKDAVSFEAESWPVMIPFAPHGRVKANEIREALKAALGQKFSGLEYVEKLQAPTDHLRARPPSTPG